MGMKVGGKEGGLNAEPNVVPMIDVMLVLLIIFMIVTPIISAGFQATMPMGRNVEASPEESGDVMLGIDNGGRYFLDPGTGTIGLVPDGQIEEMLLQVFENRTRDKILYFKADQNLEFARVQGAIEIARNAGVRVLATVVDKRQEGTTIFGGGGR